MKSRTVIQLISVSAIVILCIGVVSFYHFERNLKVQYTDFDLYALVPDDALAVVDTDNLIQLIQNVNDLHASKDGHFLFFSHLFVYLKDHINTLLESTPHGLSNRMSKTLISFHAPDNVRNQVFYCRMGEGDSEFVRQFIARYNTGNFPPKTVEYRHEKFQIYALNDGTFVTIYLGKNFMVATTEKRLMEKVIDAQKDKHSLLHTPSFTHLRESSESVPLPANIYLKVDSLFPAWTEFNVKMSADDIYVSGISHTADSISSIFSSLRALSAVKYFPGLILPASTFLFSKRAGVDVQQIFPFLTAKVPLTTAFFHTHADSVGIPSALAVLDIDNVGIVRQYLRRKGHTTTAEMDSFFHAVTGNVFAPNKPLLALHDDQLIMATDTLGLNDYKRMLAAGDSLATDRLYQEVVMSLSNTYHLTIMMDLDQIYTTPRQYMAFIPDFFYRHRKFFRHFLLAFQLEYVNDAVYPNVVLIYKHRDEA